MENFFIRILMRLEIVDMYRDLGRLQNKYFPDFHKPHLVLFISFSCIRIWPQSHDTILTEEYEQFP